MFTVALIVLYSVTLAAKASEPATDNSSGTQSQPQPAPLTLAECFTLALKQSEIIAIDLNVVKQTDAHFLQAMGSLLPHVNFSSFDQRLDKAGAGGTSSSGTSSIGIGRNVSERKFVLTQTLFSGFREFAAIKGSKMERSQRINEELRAEQLLFTDVANAFYLFLEEEEVLNAVQATRDALIERISYLKEREGVGRSRPSEVVNAQAQLYSVEADLESVKSQLELARQLMEFLIGKPFAGIAEQDKSIPPLENETEYFAQADTRSDVLAAKQAWGVSRKQIDIARADYFPTVSLESNFYTQRTTFPEDSKWDAMLSVDVPIFEGTQTYGAVQEAALKASESELTFKRTKRSALQDIRDAYVQAKSAGLQTDAYQKALSASEENYNLQKQDYGFNLVNNLDVLQAIQQLEDAKRSFIHSLYNAKRLYWQLRVAGGYTLPKE